MKTEKSKSFSAYSRRGLRAAAAAAALALALSAPLRAYDITGQVVDSAGAGVAGAKVWLQGDTTQSVTAGADGSFHFTGSPSSLRPAGKPEVSGLGFGLGADGALYLEAPRSMTLSLRLIAFDGRVMRESGSVDVTAGRNRLDKIVGPLPVGAYVLSLQGKGVSLKARLLQNGVAASAASASRHGSAALAKTASAPYDPDYKPGIVAWKDGYAPMLHVPATETETGVKVAVKKPLSAKLNHIVFIYLENWSFDALYGGFAGAEGLTQAYAADSQRDTSGYAYAKLPQPWNTGTNAADSIFPDTLSNHPFSLLPYVGLNQKIPDLVHRFYTEQLQIDGGKMDKFAAVSDARGLVMGYFPTDSLPLAAYAKQYTLCDHFFHSAFGGSFLNHQYLIAARSPLWADIPAKYRSVVDSVTGKVMKISDRKYADNQATPDGHLVNTIYTVNNPHPATAAADLLVPNLEYATIGDRLNEKGISWTWYSGGWDSATAGHPDSAFQFHHQAFAFYKNYADGTPGKAAHLKDEKDFWSAVQAGTLPAVAFIKPVGVNNEHPGYTDVLTGELHTKSIIDAIKASPAWDSTVIIISYDEHGGFHDHVAPPVIDKWGPGSRVPALIISPFAKKGYVDKHTLETVSVLSLIERRYGLVPLTARDAAAGDLTTSLDLP